ncbi:MAG TPA: hypothetical protein VFW67_04560, partial [Burkholderiaceae bacterium]|nr:hypothetical protein [Burkholderiaceae bacterium]
MARPPRPQALRWMGSLGWLVLAAALLLGGALAANHMMQREDSLSVVLLLPDAGSADLPIAQAWMDAAKEEGLQVTPMTDDEFMRYGGAQGRIAGVILPDSVHREASDLLISQLYDHVHAGGHLFLTFDAGLQTPGQTAFATDTSRLSRLAGVDYAMYRALGEHTFADDRVLGSRAAEQQLGLQPGKLDFNHSVQAPLGELTTYGYPRLHYPHLRTQPAGNARTQALLQSPAGDVIVAQHTFGGGEVLFANLPLGYLKTRTDGHLLHLLLNHFVVHMLQEPRLAAVPQGVGGMVLNLHIDSNSAQLPLLQLEREGWFKQGPFSLHLTAGPDTYEVGDRMGLDLDNNTPMQMFLRRQLALGHEVGNHGGWGHNVFGVHANDNNAAQYEPLLQRNHDSVSSIMQRPARTYSAPMGNHPVWAHRWLQDNGFKAYYFTGDNGLGPTRSFVNGQRATSRLWAFPISNFYQIATFEELEQPRLGRSADDMAQFLDALTEHVADARVARLFYFHPPAAEEYQDVLDGLSHHAQRLASLRRFQWYSMESLADFMNQREQVRWRVRHLSMQARQLVVSTEADLKDMSWVFPLATASRFEVLTGRASVRREATE